VTRRDILKSAAALAALPAAGKNSLHVHLGVQTNAWPVRAQDFSSLLGVLEKIKGYGYEGFETGYANVQGQFENAAAAKAKLEQTGLKFFGVHIFLLKYDSETNIAAADLYERVGTGGAKLGAERLILSGSPPTDEAGLKKKAEALNRAGVFAEKLGLKLAYHNHWMEFERGGVEYEFLMRETDPKRVWFLLDAGHAYRSGADVPGLIRKYHARMTGMHLRDFSEPGDFKNDLQVPLGSGKFPLKAVIGAIRQTGWSGWLLNEEERTGSKPGDAAVKPARDTLFKAVGEGS
jgi:sugar phosphate isomerase/epimerase